MFISAAKSSGILYIFHWLTRQSSNLIIKINVKCFFPLCIENGTHERTQQQRKEESQLSFTFYTIPTKALPPSLSFLRRKSLGYLVSSWFSFLCNIQKSQWHLLEVVLRSLLLIDKLSTHLLWCLFPTVTATNILCFWKFSLPFL